MQVAWGNYTHESNEVQLVNFTVRPRMSRRNLRMERQYRIHLRGELKDTGGQSALTTKINNLISAYSNDFQDFNLYDNSGNLTPHSISSTDPRNISGNRVVHRSWDGTDPVEYALIRSYEIIIEATLSDPESGLLYLSESVTTIGSGGQIWEAVNTFSGPQAAVICPQSWVRVVQQGMAIGYQGWPPARPPIFPNNFEHEERRRITPHYPQFRGQGFTHYPISWHYEFSTIFPGVYAPIV
jgi:hypothetical protein